MHKHIAKIYTTTPKPTEICRNKPLLHNYPQKKGFIKHLKTCPKTTAEIALKGHHLSAQGIALGWGQSHIHSSNRPERASSLSPGHRPGNMYNKQPTPCKGSIIHEVNDSSSTSEYSLMYQHHIFIRMALSCRDKIL